MDLAYGLKDGEVSSPTRLPNGYYLFKRIGLNTDPYEKVRDQIFTEIKQKRNLEWVEKHRKAVQVTKTTLEGKPVTPAEIEAYLGAMDEKLRSNLRDTPEELLRGIGFMRRMTRLAEEAKLDQAPPFRQQLELTRFTSTYECPDAVGGKDSDRLRGRSAAGL